MSVVLYGGSHVADELGVTKQTVANWRRRYDDTPAPTHEVADFMPLWDESGLQSWRTWYHGHLNKRVPCSVCSQVGLHKLSCQNRDDAQVEGPLDVLRQYAAKPGMVYCHQCGEDVAFDLAYRDGPRRPFHWNDQGGGHTMLADPPKVHDHAVGEN